MGFSGFAGGRILYRIKTQKHEKIVNHLRCETDVRNIKIKDGKLEFCVSLRYCKKADEIIGKCDTETIEKHGFGMLYALLKYRRRVGLFVGFLLSFLFIFVSSFYVWDIRVEGLEKVPESLVIERLSEAGFTVGMRKDKVNIKSVVNKLLINENSLSWAAINFDGTVAHVEVREAKNGVLVDKKQNVNLVASTDGIIIRVDALDGSAAVKKGDVVTKGQLLVSAFVEKRTGGSLLKGARGFVFANTVHSYRVEVPLKYTEKEYTGKSYTMLELSVLGKNIKLPALSVKDFEKCDIDTYNGKVRISDSIYLPVDVNLKRIKEYRTKDKRRPENYALEIAKKETKTRLRKDYPNFVIAGLTEKIEVENGKLVYICTFSGVENIAKPLEFVLS